MKFCKDCEIEIPKGLNPRCFSCGAKKKWRAKTGPLKISIDMAKPRIQSISKVSFHGYRKLYKCEFPQSVKDAWDRFVVLFPDTAEHSRWWKCLACEAPHKNCFHHLFGRGGGSYEIRMFHNSILNSFPCNNEKCHISSGETVHTTTPGDLEVQVVFTIVKTAVDQGLYSWTKKDRDFYAHYHEIYERLGLHF